MAILREKQTRRRKAKEDKKTVYMLAASDRKRTF